MATEGINEDKNELRLRKRKNIRYQEDFGSDSEEERRLVAAEQRRNARKVKRERERLIANDIEERTGENNENKNIVGPSTKNNALDRRREGNRLAQQRCRQKKKEEYLNHMREQERLAKARYRQILTHEQIEENRERDREAHRRRRLNLTQQQSEVNRQRDREAHRRRRLNLTQQQSEVNRQRDREAHRRRRLNLTHEQIEENRQREREAHRRRRLNLTHEQIEENRQHDREAHRRRRLKERERWRANDIEELRSEKNENENIAGPSTSLTQEQLDRIRERRRQRILRMVHVPEMYIGISNIKQEVYSAGIRISHQSSSPETEQTEAHLPQVENSVPLSSNQEIENPSAPVDTEPKQELVETQSSSANFVESSKEQKVIREVEEKFAECEPRPATANELKKAMKPLFALSKRLVGPKGPMRPKPLQEHRTLRRTESSDIHNNTNFALSKRLVGPKGPMRPKPLQEHRTLRRTESSDIHNNTNPHSYMIPAASAGYWMPCPAPPFSVPIYSNPYQPAYQPHFFYGGALPGYDMQHY